MTGFARSWRALMLGAGLFVATPVFADSTESAPIVSVSPDPQGGVGVVRGSVEIKATPATVWKVLIDCSRVSHLMLHVKYCKVLQHDPAGKWDVREQVTTASILPAVKAVIRSDYDAPRDVKFHRIGGDFKIMEGEWTLEPLDGGTRTRVSYESRLSSPFPVPMAFIRSALKGDFPITLNNLRAASEAEPPVRP